MKSQPNSEGHRLLLELPSSGRAIARRLGTSPMTIANYRRGDRIPPEETRVKLESHFGIPRGAWDRRPWSAEMQAEKAGISHPDVKPASDFPAAGICSPLEEIDRQVAMMTADQQDHGLSPMAKVKYSEQIGRLLSQKANIEAKLETVETRYWSSAAGARLKEALLRLCDDFPGVEEKLLSIFEEAGA